MSTNSATAECPICQEDVSPSSRAILDPCMHEFDRSCIAEWTKIRNSCPVCRATYELYRFDIVSDQDFYYQVVGEEGVRHNADDSDAQVSNGAGDLLNNSFQELDAALIGDNRVEDELPPLGDLTMDEEFDAFPEYIDHGFDSIEFPELQVAATDYEDISIYIHDDYRNYGFEEDQLDHVY